MTITAIRRLCQHTLVLLLGLGLAGTALADDAPADLRVGISADYPPFSAESSVAPGAFEGFDVALAKAYAEERGQTIRFVRFRWPDLLDDLAADRFDIAMSGITVRPERSARGYFSVPVVESGAVVLVREPDRWENIDRLDNRLARIGVNSGGHLEQVARERFPLATLVAIPDNTHVLLSLIDENLDAAVSDTAEVPAWLSQLEGAAVFGPFTRDRKAFLTRPRASKLAADLDDWLLAWEADGRLQKLRDAYPGTEAPAIGGVLGALLAAVDERLSLMPLIGAAKREQGIPLEVPEREKLVLDSAVEGMHAAAERAAIEPPPDEAVRALFHAQMKAAKEVQWAAVQDRDFDPEPPLPSVEDVLRPALLRIGTRIARLVLVLPAEHTPEEVLAAARSELRAPYLTPESIDAIAAAISGLRASVPAAQPRETSRAIPPATKGSSTHTP